MMFNLTKNSPPTNRRLFGINCRCHWLIVLAIVVLFGMLLLFNRPSHAPQDVSAQFVADVQQRKVNAAYRLFSETARSVTDLNLFNATVFRIGPILTGTPKIIDKEIGTGASAAPRSTVIYEIAGKDGKTYSFTVNLVQENDTWKVLNFQSKPK